jgi:uncharacterized membrane protein
MMIDFSAAPPFVKAIYRIIKVYMIAVCAVTLFVMWGLVVLTAFAFLKELVLRFELRYGLPLQETGSIILFVALIITILYFTRGKDPE